jgi:hypothetical protein
VRLQQRRDNDVLRTFWQTDAEFDGNELVLGCLVFVSLHCCLHGEAVLVVRKTLCSINGLQYAIFY